MYAHIDTRPDGRDRNENFMTSFEDLGISAKLIDAMNEMGWTEPTPVQCEAVPVGIAGNDLIAKAQTGTGKTGAYAMIVMSRIGKGSKVPSALIIAPTRELAMQVDAELRKLSKLSGHVSVAVYGGAPIDRQINSLRRGADIVVGTPGRLKDMIEREALDLSQVREVVLDEADRMLDMGFEDDLDFIMEEIPDGHQTLLFSATLNRDVMRIAGEMLDNPAEVDISGDTPTTGLTKQYIIPCRRNEKKSVLYELLDRGTPKTIVFFATKAMVEDVYLEMKERGRKVGTLHGDMAQKLRERVIGSFRDNQILTLLATDVAARGLDISDVDLVVNFDLPIDPESYLHRIGRTGRAGKEGVSVSLVNPRDRKLVRMCEEEADTEMERITPEELDPIEAEHEPVVRERVRKEKKMKVEKHRNNDRRNREGGERFGFATLAVNLGKADNVNRSDVADFLKQRADLPEDAIGKIGLRDDCAFVEVSLDHSDYILENVSGCDFNGKTVTVEPAPAKKVFRSDEKKSDDGFDRRRENRYRNYEKRKAEEAESEESGEEEYCGYESGESDGYRPRRDYGRRDDRRGGYGDRPRHEGGYGRGRGYGGYREGGYGHREGGYRDRDDRRGGYGDRPRREYGDRPRGEYGDRGYVRRDFGGRNGSSSGERRGYPERKDYGDRPRRDYGDRPRREYGDRPRREGGYRERDDRPRRDYGRRDDRRGGYGDRPRRDGYGGDRREGGYGSDRGNSRGNSSNAFDRRYGSNRDKPKKDGRRGKY